MILIALYLSAYLLGSIPFAVILGKMKGIDILKSTSGNPGMTNVWRTLGPFYGVVCFILDVAKSLLPTLVARHLVTTNLGPLDAQFIWFTVGVAAVIGHSASPFLRFKGGKGVSSALGVILGVSPLVGLSCFGVFLVVLLLTRYVSVASVVGVWSVVVFTFVFPHQSIQIVPIFVILAAFVAYRHRKNFKRVRDRTEPKIF